MEASSEDFDLVAREQLRRMAWLADTLFYGAEPCVDGMTVSACEAESD
jgi:hypothetical protein